MASEDSSSGWQLTESDPGVFSELLNTLGAKDLIVDDLYSLDADALSTLQPVHALIFLFKWVGNSDERGGGQGTFDDTFPGFFAHQVVNNACATLAVLNALLNIPGLTVGPEIEELRSFTLGMDPQSCGLTVTSSEFLRAAHNALSPPSAVSLDGLNIPQEKSEDAYHFVVYVPVAGSVYELDGLKRSPVRHGPYSESGEGWISKAREVIEARIATYPVGSLEFNLMAIHSDNLEKMRVELQQAQSKNQEFAVSQLAIQITQEEEKRRRWAFENSLRRHNHVGLVHALVLALAKAGKLDSVTAQARTKMKERIENNRKQRELLEN